MITRHFIDVDGRRVHYRKAGRGPVLLLVHQSPRSSAEYEPLMRAWSEHFTCIAPDTPGFGQSEPLPDAPEIGTFADALVALLDALALDRVGAYGFHSGGIILVSALKRHPGRFTGVAVGGYAVWTEEERRVFGEHYLPPFRPSAYGEHLTWLWNRILEQAWFFPWFDPRNETRLGVAHADPVRVDAVVTDMLDSGDAYRAGYGAVLRARRELPGPDEATCPVLITAYDGDPLQAHLARLGELPPSWSARPVATPAEQHAASLAHLLAHPAPPAADLPESRSEGFAHLRTSRFDGLIHWRGAGKRLLVHAPGGSLELLDRIDGVAIDLPGHGLSDDWPEGARAGWEPWAELIDAAAARFGADEIVHAPVPRGDPDRLFPDLTPDRFGAHLTAAWSIARARHLFSPWYDATAGHAIPFDPDAIRPERLAREHRALLQARSARQFLIARREGEKHGHPRGHAAARAA